jgi:MoxR-like ATPase
MAFTKPNLDVDRVIELEQILSARATLDGLHVDEKVRDYIVHIVFATRDPAKYKLPDLAPLMQFGASPRATISLTLAAKAWALMHGRAYVTPDDIKAIGPDVLRHRILLTYEAEAQGVTSDAIVKRIFDHVPVP